MTDAAGAPADPTATLRSKRFLVLLVLAGIVGLVVSFAAWGFLELLHQIQVGVSQGLPKDLGFSGTPRWWYLPVLAFAGLVTAFAIARPPAPGGGAPADLFSGREQHPNSVASGKRADLGGRRIVLEIGPEAPLIAL